MGSGGGVDAGSSDAIGSLIGSDGTSSSSGGLTQAQGNQLLGTLGKVTGKVTGDLSSMWLKSAASQYKQQQLLTNAQLDDIHAGEEIQSGRISAEILLRRRVAPLISSQRASYAAQGVEVNSGSAQQVQESTHKEAIDDALMIRNNAWRKAFGYEFDAINERTAARMEEISDTYQKNMGWIDIGYTGLSTASQAIGMFGGGE